MTISFWYVEKTMTLKLSISKFFPWFFSASALFVNRTAGELLFDGYEDQLLAIAEWSGTKSRTPLDKFGYFYKVTT